MSFCSKGVEGKDDGFGIYKSGGEEREKGGNKGMDETSPVCPNDPRHRKRQSPTEVQILFIITRIRSLVEKDAKHKGIEF